MRQTEALEYFAVQNFVAEYNKVHKRKLVLVKQCREPMPDTLCKLNDDEVGIEVAHTYGVGAEPERLQRLIGCKFHDHLRASHRGWTEEYLGNGSRERQDEWTASVAVGERSFVERAKALLGFRAKGRDDVEGKECYQLREGAGYYKAVFEPEKGLIGAENTHFWDTSVR